MRKKIRPQNAQHENFLTGGEPRVPKVVSNYKKQNIGIVNKHVTSINVYLSLPFKWASDTFETTQSTLKIL